MTAEPLVLFEVDAGGVGTFSAKSPRQVERLYL